MRDIVKENEQRFIEEQKNLTNVLIEEIKLTIFSDWREQSKNILSSLVQIISPLRSEYNKEKESGEVSDLSYLQFSWLRTGVRCQTNLYRIDLYDNRWLSNIIEVAVTWTPPYIFEGLKKIENRLRPQFERHTLINGALLDEIIFESADKMNIIFLSLLPSLIPDMLSTVFPDEAKQLKVYAGDFLDHSDCIYPLEV